MIILNIDIEKKLSEEEFTTLINFMEKIKKFEKILMISFQINDNDRIKFRSFLSSFLINLAVKNVDLSTLAINFDIKLDSPELHELFKDFLQTISQNLNYLIV